MPSTLQSANTANNSIITSSVAQAPATNTSSWPSLEHNSNNLNHGTTANTSLDIQQPPKPKTFASVAASKKTQPPPPLPPPMMVMQQFNDIKPSSNAVYESSQVKNLFDLFKLWLPEFSLGQTTAKLSASTSTTCRK